MDPRTPLDERLPSAFRVADGLACGLGRKRLRHESLERPFRGVRVQPADPAPADEAPAAAHRRELRARMDHYAPVMPEHAFFVGLTAAVLWGIPVPPASVRPVEGTVRALEVGVWDPRTPPRRPGVHGMKTTHTRAAVVEVAGLRVTRMADTWAMLAAHLDEGDLVVAADHLIHVPRHGGDFRPPEREAHCTREELAAAIGTRRGAAKLRRALARARVGAASPPETRLRLLVVDAGLPEPVLDHDVRNEHGWWIATVDAAYPEWKIALEYDGEGHRTQKQFERDVDRLAELEAAGWIVLRFTARHLRDQRALVAARVRTAIARRAVRPGAVRPLQQP